MGDTIQEFVDSVVDNNPPPPMDRAVGAFVEGVMHADTHPGGPSPAARHIDDWHEDMGDVLWWTNPITEAPYVGNPLCLGIGYELSIGEHSHIVHLGGWPGYHEWWTPLPAPPETFTPARVIPSL